MTAHRKIPVELWKAWSKDSHFLCGTQIREGKVLPTIIERNGQLVAGRLLYSIKRKTSFVRVWTPTEHDFIDGMRGFLRAIVLVKEGNDKTAQTR
jgi:hypothetical protein